MKGGTINQGGKREEVEAESQPLGLERKKEGEEARAGLGGSNKATFLSFTPSQEDLEVEESPIQLGRLPHTDALVVTLTIANYQTRRILVDTWSSTDILFKSAFDYMGVPREKVVPVSCHLLGFAGENVLPIGSIDLPITAGTYPRQKVIMVKFLIVDRVSAYNAIIGRTALNDLKAVTSTPHISMKFPTEEGVGVVKGDQKEARCCYNLSLKSTPRKHNLSEKAKEDGK